LATRAELRLARFRGHLPLSGEGVRDGPKTSYPPEFRRKIIDLLRAGRPARAVAQDFQPSRRTISNWCKQDDLDSGRRSDGLTLAENEDLSWLRKRVRQLEVERDILSKPRLGLLARPIRSNRSI